MICARAPRRAPYVCSKISAAVTPRNSSARPHVRTSAPHSRKSFMGAGKRRERRTIIDGDAGGVVRPFVILTDQRVHVHGGIPVRVSVKTRVPPLARTTLPTHPRGFCGGSLFNLCLTRGSKIMNSVEGAGPNSLPHHKGRELPQARAWKPVSTKDSTGPSVCVLASIGDQKRYHDSLGGVGVVIMKQLLPPACAMLP